MNALKFVLVFLTAFSGTTLVYSDVLEANIFEGRYHGQGRGCGGILTIQDKNISWHSQALNCEIDNYTITEEEHGGFSHRIIYRVKPKNKTCPLFAIELGHVESFSSYMVGWYGTGFFTEKEYENRQDPASASYVCALIKDYNPRNNPEPKDLTAQ
ncbi:MAG: hypothetical protein V4812_07080 [Pseudomonadota bacterium]